MWVSGLFCAAGDQTQGLVWVKNQALPWSHAITSDSVHTPLVDTGNLERSLSWPSPKTILSPLNCPHHYHLQNISPPSCMSSCVSATEDFSPQEGPYDPDMIYELWA